jgi:hypothetical protein
MSRRLQHLQVRQAAKWFGVALATGALLFAPRANAYCPSYTPQLTAANSKCAIQPALGTNPSVSQLNALFAKAALGNAGWGAGGPSIPTLNQGCRKPNPPVAIPARFPCVLIKALAIRESAWQQFCVPSSPAAAVGAPSRTLVSFDCGYGIGQVTSGMHVGENPGFDRARVASDPLYSLAVGMGILRQKWSATQCVGDNDPDVVEDWYNALWAYNGLAYSNNPNNPKHKAGRGPYNPSGSSAYPYQELLFGWMEFPPGASYWASLPAAYPNRGQIGTGGAPPALDEPSCASPTDCTKKRPTHAGNCGPSARPDGGGPTPPDSGLPSADAGDEAVQIPDAGVAGPNDPINGPTRAGDDPSATSSGCCATSPATSQAQGVWGATLALIAMSAIWLRRKQVKRG